MGQSFHDIAENEPTVRSFFMAVILVVDDEKKINDLISMNLEMVGHRAIQAFTSKEAL